MPTHTVQLVAWHHNEFNAPNDGVNEKRLTPNLTQIRPFQRWCSQSISGLILTKKPVHAKHNSININNKASKNEKLPRDSCFI